MQTQREIIIHICMQVTRNYDSVVSLHIYTCAILLCCFLSSQIVMVNLSL